MAASSMKDIKLRIHSVESTMQITKAMELVASSKLRRAKEKAEQSRPYFDALHATLTDIAYGNTEFESPYVAKRQVKCACFVIIAGDRGLAGGYNSNLFKAFAAKSIDMPKVCALPIGKKAAEYCRRNNISTVSDAYGVAETVSLGDCFSIASMLSGKFCEGEFDELHVCYTNFVSMLSQEPAVLKLLPLNYEAHGESRQTTNQLVRYEPSCTEVYDAIVPEYVGGLVYGALRESIASELGARRTAMDAASKNASEMIEDLSLRYNRARQGAITQEITEIVAGAS
ncbi:MAG: ATP synthase F1 subunit gamma [Oscillospiraceae bacterium]